ncbi:MAG: HTTM domain-containing protein [Verrucomicrobiota bacterium]
MIARLTRILDRWIFERWSMSHEQLAAYRICYAGFMLFIVGVHRYAWLERMHDGFFHPPHPSIASLAFSGFPPGGVFDVVEGLIILSLFGILFGYRTRLFSILFTLAMVFGNSFAYSLGKINHDFIVQVVPLVMAFSSWGEAWSLDARKRRSAPGGRGVTWPVTLMSVVMGLAYFSAGLPKLLGGWLHLDSMAVRGKLFTLYHVQGRQDYLAPFFIKIDQQWFWEFMDWFTVAWELGFIIAIFNPRVFRCFVGITVVFTLMVLLMLNVWAIILYPLFLLFAMPLIPCHSDRVQGFMDRVPGWAIPLAAVIYWAGMCMRFPVSLLRIDYWLTGIEFVPLLVCLAAVGVMVWVISLCVRGKQAA